MCDNAIWGSERRQVEIFIVSLLRGKFLLSFRVFVKFRVVVVPAYNVIRTLQFLGSGSTNLLSSLVSNFQVIFGRSGIVDLLSAPWAKEN